MSVVSRLHERDFELLIDLILARSGWARVATLGGNTEGLDIEAENYSINEIAFVQVKSRANQALLDKYTTKFNARRRRYNRMIFAVHTPEGILNAPKRPPVQVWTIDKIASLVVRHGLGE